MVAIYHIKTPICLQEERRAQVLERFGTFVKGALSKGLPENDATGEAQTLLWGTHTPACKHSMLRVAGV